MEEKGKESSEQIDKYSEFCHLKLKELVLPKDLTKCATNFYSIEKHKPLLEAMYHDIVGILTEVSDYSFNQYRSRSRVNKHKPILCWNKYVARTGRLGFVVKNFIVSKFCKNANKLNPKQSLPVGVAGVPTHSTEIENAFKRHF